MMSPVVKRVKSETLVPKAKVDSEIHFQAGPHQARLRSRRGTAIVLHLVNSIVVTTPDAFFDPVCRIAKTRRVAVPRLVWPGLYTWSYMFCLQILRHTLHLYTCATGRDTLFTAFSPVQRTLHLYPGRKGTSQSVVVCVGEYPGGES